MVLSAPSGRKQVVIVGAGFGGLATARGLAGVDADVVLIDRRNHHLFQPLLYQVATAALSPADIAAPVRSILRNQSNVRVVLGEVTAIDRPMQQVRLADGSRIAFDALVLATGARHSYFGRDEWARHAPGIKSIEDATAVRRKVLLALERAETEADPARRHALLSFVVIGGGPTGVEMAGAIAELAQRSVSRDFRSITPHCSRVILINLAPRLLEAFPEHLSARAQRDLARLGVEVRNSTPVQSIGADHVVAGDEYIGAFTTIWAAGVKASPAATWLNVEADRSGRVIVDRHLNPQGDRAVFIIGDVAHCADGAGRPLPGIAPVAKQQGAYVARAIAARLDNRPVAPFRYRHGGNLAAIGRSHAVIDFGTWTLAGFPAWVLWSVAHVWFLANYRNRLFVAANLLWNYLTYARHARLITGDAPIEGADPIQGEYHVEAA